MKSRKPRKLKVPLRAPRYCTRCGRQSQTRFCIECLPTMRDALSQVVWSWSVGVFIAAAFGLIAVLHFGRAETVASGPLLASLALWAKMTSLALVLVLLICATSAIGCLIWLDLWRVYRGDSRQRTSGRDRRMAFRFAGTVAADLGRWRALQKAASLAAGHKPLPFWGWCLLGLAEACRQVGSMGSKALRLACRFAVHVFQAGAVLSWLCGRGLRLALARASARSVRVWRWARPRVHRGLRVLRRRAHRAGKATARGMHRAGPHLAAWSKAALRATGQVLRRLTRAGGRASVAASSWLICAALWSARKVGQAIQIAARACAVGVCRVADNVRRHHRDRPPVTTRYQAARAVETSCPAEREPVADDRNTATCPSCGRTKPMPPEGSYVCGDCGVRFAVRDGLVGLQASCPGCGRERMVPRTGRYQCGQCRLTFSVTATGSVVDAGCPGCGKFRPVDRLGRYACSSCGLEFEVTREGVWVDATCPVCRRSRQVSRMGRFECSRCQSVFRAEPGRTVVEATCPACAEVQDVEGPGIFRCNGCDTVFTVAGPEAENSPRPQVAADRSDARQEQQRILRRFMATETKRRIRSEPSKPADATA